MQNIIGFVCFITKILRGVPSSGRKIRPTQKFFNIFFVEQLMKNIINKKKQKNIKKKEIVLTFITDSDCILL
jgi:hypothetical protein